jgi:hypothetical protein
MYAVVELRDQVFGAFLSSCLLIVPRTEILWYNVKLSGYVSSYQSKRYFAVLKDEKLPASVLPHLAVLCLIRQPCLRPS